MECNRILTGFTLSQSSVSLILCFCSFLWDAECFAYFLEGTLYFHVIAMMTAAVICPVGSGVVRSLTTAVYPRQSEISSAAYGELSR